MGSLVNYGGDSCSVIRGEGAGAEVAGQEVSEVATEEVTMDGL